MKVIMNPLNPTLHTLLKIHFGNVTIVSEGQPILWHESVGGMLTTSQTRHDGPTVKYPGEEYKVNCPFCSDTRQRLYINHSWGVFDSKTNKQNLFLCQCFNEQCVDNFDRQVQLQDMVFAPAPDQKEGHYRICEGEKKPKGDVKIELPGLMLSLEDLIKRDPLHYALEYLRSRNFDPLKLSRMYRVGFCYHSKFPMARNRIIIPFVESGKLVGWQARFVGTPPRINIPRYWTCPGMSTNDHPYNLERALQHQTVVVVEGATDSWSFGPQSFALLKKRMAPLTLRSIFAKMTRSRYEDQAIAVMLDPKQDIAEQAKGKLHHIEELYQSLKVALPNRAFPVYLPDGKDPGALDRQFLRECVYSAADAFGVKVSFKKPVAEVAV